jgi:hypothetical protein
MPALTDPTRSYDRAKYIGREWMESFRADFVRPGRLQVTARTSQNFLVTENLDVHAYIPDSDVSFGFSR